MVHSLVFVTLAVSAALALLWLLTVFNRWRRRRNDPRIQQEESRRWLRQQQAEDRELAKVATARMERAAIDRRSIKPGMQSVPRVPPSQHYQFEDQEQSKDRRKRSEEDSRSNDQAVVTMALTDWHPTPPVQVEHHHERRHHHQPVADTQVERDDRPAHVDHSTHHSSSHDHSSHSTDSGSSFSDSGGGSTGGD